MPSYAISQATRDVLTALRNINYTGDVLLHAFVLRTTNLLSTILVAPDLANRRVNIVQFMVAGN